MALTDNLISFWELGEASGTRNDSHGSNHLTDNNTVASNTGKVGDAAQFATANAEYLSRASNASLQTGDIDFTFSCWVYLDSAVAQVIIGKDSGSIRDYYLYIDSTIIEFTVFSPTDVFEYIDYTGTFNTGTWYFIVASHNAATNILSVSVNDGTPQTIGTSAPLQSPTAALFTVGNRDNGASPLHFDGRIDQVGFWKRDLFETPADITQLYNGGAGLSYAAMNAAAVNQYLPPLYQLGAGGFVGHTYV